METKTHCEELQCRATMKNNRMSLANNLFKKGIYLTLTQSESYATTAAEIEREW